MKTILSRQSLIILSVLQGVGILIVFSDVFIALYLTGMVLITVLMMNDYINLPVKQNFKLRIHHPGQSVLNEDFIIKIHLLSDNIKRWMVFKLYKINSDLISFTFDNDKFKKNTDNNQSEITIEVDCQGKILGDNTNIKIVIATRSIFGFFKRHYIWREQKFEIKVIPPMSPLPERHFQVLTKNQKLLKRGAHLIKKSRAAEQFHSLRDYRFPDPMRHIEYKKSAKFGTLKTKTFENMHSIELVICLDVGRSIFGEINGSRKLDYYLSALTNLARYAIKMNDKLSLLVYSNSNHLLLKNIKSYPLIINKLSDTDLIRPYEVKSNYSLIIDSLSLFSTNRSIVLLLGDTSHPFTQDSLLNIIKKISQKHLVYSLSLLEQKYELISRVVEHDEDDFSSQDMSEFLYSYWLKDQMNQFSSNANIFGSGSLVVPDKYWMSTTEKVYQRLRDSGRI